MSKHEVGTPDLEDSVFLCIKLAWIGLKGIQLSLAISRYSLSMFI